MLGLDCAEGALGGEGVWGKGTGDLGYDRDVEEFGEADAVGGYIFVFVLVALVGLWVGGGWRLADGLLILMGGVLPQACIIPPRKIGM